MVWWRDRAVMRPEDRPVVIAVAVQMWCARLQFMAEARTADGKPRYGYSPDLEMVVGEAAALVSRVDSHIAPGIRAEAIIERRGKRQKIELNYQSDNGGG